MRVTVAGGGVAGSVCALALRRIGADVTVYEAYPDPASAVGGFVSLAANGLRALDAVGCLDTVQAYGVEVPLQRVWGATGRLLGENPRGRRSVDLTYSRTLRRADLVAVLREAARRAGARIVTGERVTAATEAGDQVHVTLRSGNTVDSDLLIGADGIWSTVRTALDAHAPTPEYASFYTVFGASSTPTEPGVFNLAQARTGALLFLAAGDTTWWAAQVNTRTPPDPASVTLASLRDMFSHPILDNATDLGRPTLDHVLAPVPTWRSARTVLIGDAAHPVGAGQGASMAIEDAVVLAQRLAGQPVPPALAAYENARRPRVTKMLKAGQDNRARKKTVGPVRRRVAESMMSFGLNHFYEKATGWLYTYDVGELPVHV